MESIGIILSGTYCNSEVREQYGEIPPSFLPIFGERLYLRQVEYMKEFCTKVYLTIPLNYPVTKFDDAILKSMGVTIVRCDPIISINEALILVLALILNDNYSIAVLYGDTVLGERIPINGVTVSKMPKTYTWGRNSGVVKFESLQKLNIKMMMSGFFHLSNLGVFKKALEKSGGEILKTLDIYDDSETLQYIEVNTWKDFGHLGTIQNSKLEVAESRYFNSVKITQSGAEKYSKDKRKLSAEVSWYQNLPKEMTKYVPKLITSSHDFYTTDYISSPTVHELITSGNFNENQWTRLFKSLFNYFLDCRKFYNSSDAIELEYLINKKTRERNQIFISSKPKLMDFSNKELLSILSEDNITLLTRKVDTKSEKYLGFLHGDMCASNIFWDGSLCSIKVIDPRGDSTGKTSGIYGDIRYDIAKLYQSFILGYDHVLAGTFKYRANFEKSHQSYLPNDQILNFSFLLEKNLLKPLEIEREEIEAIATLLMMGLLPLHKDRVDRQNEFLFIIIEMLRKINK